ncbi:MAG TPA: hypothetical protein VFZ87_01085 [Gemmatimonadales bacterium]
MPRYTQAVPLAFSSILLMLVAACSQRTQADPTPDISLSTSDEGVPPAPRSGTKSPRTSGDTLICDQSRKYSTPDGDRWLWVRILVQRAPGDTTDNTTAETAVSTDRDGMEYAREVALAGISLQGLENGREYTLRNASGVRTSDTKKSGRQAHTARGYTRGPDMGPLSVSCGG